jgi:hypothetical protein
MASAHSRDRLHALLLQLTANSAEPLSTAELRDLAQAQAQAQAQPAPAAGPLVIETVYLALRTLHRRGQVTHHNPGGRHVRWSLTPSGQHAASRPVEHGSGQQSVPY